MAVPENVLIYNVPSLLINLLTISLFIQSYNLRKENGLKIWNGMMIFSASVLILALFSTVLSASINFGLFDRWIYPTP